MCNNTITLKKVVVIFRWGGKRVLKGLKGVSLLMKKQRGVFRLIGLIIVCTILIPLPSHADLAYDDAFEGAIWELILEDYIELPNGIVQSITLTSHYLITMENMRSSSPINNVIKAYHLHDVDRFGNPVERFSLAMQVEDMNWEHGNGMAYNPNTGEVAVSLYTHSSPETRGSLFIMDPLTLSYIRTVHVSDDFNILGIGYDKPNDRYIIQTNHEANYAIMILNSDFEIIEFIGEFKDVNVGSNYQDLIVSGNYVINWPMVLGTEVDNHIMVFCLERANLVAATPVDFGFEDTVTWNEPESIAMIEPGVFIASVTVVNNGVRSHRLYQTEVPMAIPFEASSYTQGEASLYPSIETSLSSPVETPMYPDMAPSASPSEESSPLMTERAKAEDYSPSEMLLPGYPLVTIGEIITNQDETALRNNILQTALYHLGVNAQAFRQHLFTGTKALGQQLLIDAKTLQQQLLTSAGSFQQNLLSGAQVFQQHLLADTIALQQYLLTGVQILQQHLLISLQVFQHLLARGVQGMLSTTFRNIIIIVLATLSGFAFLQKIVNIKRERARLQRKSRRERDRFARMLLEQEVARE
jgi:hypothetical protein